MNHERCTSAWVTLESTKELAAMSKKHEPLPPFFRVNDQIMQAMMQSKSKNGQRVYKLQNVDKPELKESQIGEIDENTLFKVLQYEDCDVPIQEAMSRDQINIEAFESARTVIGVSPTSSFNYNKHEDEE